MSLEDFWMSVRTGARFITPIPVADSIGMDRAEVERALRNHPVWATPDSVEWFDPKDFDFLPAPERQELIDSVERFLSVVLHVSPDQPATDQQVQEALPYFQRITEILRMDKYADAEALVLGKRIERQLADKFPQSVQELRFETGPDLYGSPALWIWVILKDEAAEEEVFSSNVRAVRELLTRTVRKLRLERWPFVRFRSADELDPPAVWAKK
jgi:hypothetical protein